MRVMQLSSCAVVAVDELFARIARGGPGLTVQLRDPELDGRALYQLGRELRRRTRAVGARLVVNDRLDLAVLLEADGVHLGRRSVAVRDARALLGTTAWVSVSAHGLDEAIAAREASAVLLSPIFASPGKERPLGPEALAAARRGMPAEVLLVALGGVTLDNAGRCFAAGADAVASIRADLTPLCEEC